LRIYINASIGYWVYSDVALFYANTTSVKYIDVIVEKPLNMTGLEVILRDSSGNTVLVVDATSYNKYELSLPQGESVYTVTIVVNSDKPTRGVFRIGFYIKNT
jgi:membrane-anchored protein YejM (alkaline phosphatase superfamily)